MARAQRLLITGFDAFPGVPDNPTARLVRWLDGDAGALRRRGLEVRTAVLPVDWRDCAAETDRLLADYAPDVTLHFGAHRRAAGFRIEQWARNATSIHPDARGGTACGPQVRPGAPRALRGSIPAARLVQKLRALGLPATASSDCGRYLCNTLYFLALDEARRRGRPRLTQFVHVPALIGADAGEPETLSWAGLRRGATALVACLMAEHDRLAARHERGAREQADAGR